MASKLTNNESAILLIAKGLMRTPQIYSVSSKRIIPHEKSLFDPKLPAWNHLFLGQSEHKDKIIAGLVKTTQELSSKRFNILMLTPVFNKEMEKICKLSGGLSFNLSTPKYSVALFKYPLQKSCFKEEYFNESFKHISSKYPSVSIAYLKNEYLGVNKTWGSEMVKSILEEQYPLVELEINYSNTVAHEDYVNLVTTCIQRMTKTLIPFARLATLINTFYKECETLTLSSFRDFIKDNEPELFLSLESFVKDSTFPFFDCDNHDPELLNALSNGVVYVSDSLNCQNGHKGFYSDFIIHLLMMNQNLSSESKIFWWEPRSLEHEELLFIFEETRSSRKRSKVMILVPHRRLENFSGEVVLPLLSNSNQIYLFKFLPEAWTNGGEVISKLVESIPNGTQTVNHTLGDKFIKNSTEAYPNDVKFLVL